MKSLNNVFFCRVQFISLWIKFFQHHLFFEITTLVTRLKSTFLQKIKCFDTTTDKTLVSTFYSLALSLSFYCLIWRSNWQTFFYFSSSLVLILKTPSKLKLFQFLSSFLFFQKKKLQHKRKIYITFWICWQ